MDSEIDTGNVLENNLQKFAVHYQNISKKKNNDIGKYITDVLTRESITEKKNFKTLQEYNQKLTTMISKAENMNTRLNKNMNNMKSNIFNLLSKTYTNNDNYILVDDNYKTFFEIYETNIENNDVIDINMAYFPDYLLYYL